MGFPHGHRKTTTLVAGLRMTGMVAPMGPINGKWFEAYCEERPSEPYLAFGASSGGSPICSSPQNAPTTSNHAAMNRTERNTF